MVRGRRRRVHLVRRKSRMVHLVVRLPTTIVVRQAVLWYIYGRCNVGTRTVMWHNLMFSMVALWYVGAVMSSKLLIRREDSRWTIPGLLNSCAGLRDWDIA